MNWTRLVLRGLVHHRRTHVGVILGAAVATAVLVGALLVGDSVRASLRRQAESRIGQVDAMLASHDRFFQDTLGQRLVEHGGPGPGAPALILSGVAVEPASARRVPGVQVLGVDQRFFALGPGGQGPELGRGEVALNPRLARQLEADVGDSLVLRVEQPSAMPRDTVMATTDETATALRVKVIAILGDGQFGRFGLQASQVPAASAFVSMAWLQQQLEQEGRANLLLLGGAEDGGTGSAHDAVSQADAALRAALELADAELSVRLDENHAELLSTRVFLDPAVAEAAAALPQPALGVLTYFVNEARIGERVAAYSIVSALGPLDPTSAAAVTDLGADPLVGGLDDDGIVLNEWLAEDLEAKVGETLTLRYYEVGPALRLTEAEASFTIRRIVPIEGLAADRTLMPKFPGLHDADHCRDWEPGIPVDRQRLVPRDEEYWDLYRGTPRAFLTLNAGRRLWGNRFGALTAVRFADAEVAGPLRDALRPGALGLYFQDVRGRAMAAATTATDFGGLFLGLSFFLIVAALLLTALLFVFGVEQRASEMGALRAVGFRVRQVRRLFLAEGLLLACLGALLGCLVAVGYTQLVLRGLATVWQGAVGDTELVFHATPGTLVGGTVGSVLTAWLAMVWAVRRQARRTAVELLRARPGDVPAAVSRRRLWRWVLAGAGLAGALVLAVTTDTAGGPAAAGAFFGAGALLLIGGLALSSLLLEMLGRERRDPRRSVGGLGIHNSLRRRGRSLATVALLAGGCFLVVAVGAQRLGAPRDPGSRQSGTGGFRWIGESSLPVLHDLNSADGLDAYGLRPDDVGDAAFVPLRVRDGDDASCLNLSLSQQPRLLGVPPAALATRGAFLFADRGGVEAAEQPWTLLHGADPEVVPAIGDQASVTWALHKKVGDTLAYRDERGEEFQVQIVATVAGSILQGNLLVAEDAFVSRFPSEPGYRMMLVDGPSADAEAVAQALREGLEDVGFTLTETADRLADFNAVQNTYLTIFQMLGGLGLLLGTAGLGMVVLRNVLERRDELAVARALGFSRRAVRWLVVSEHGFLLALGLVCGVFAAVLAILPALRSGVSATSVVPLLVVTAGVALSGLAWVLVAALVALRGNLMAALQQE